jgi:hypothetical protein
MNWPFDGKNRQVTIVMPDGGSLVPIGGLIARFVI